MRGWDFSVPIDPQAGVPLFAQISRIIAADIGRGNGLRYIYAGNLPGQVGALEDTHCATCGELLIGRYGYLIRKYRVTPAGRCPGCDRAVPGRWSEKFDRQIASRPFLPGERSRLSLLKM